MTDNSSSPGHCEYGVGVSLISLTVPYNFDFVEWASIFWSGLPFVLMAMFALGYILTRRQTAFIISVCGLLGSSINEFTVKTASDDPRPPQSCLKSGGMPSGHALTGMALYGFILLEYIQRPLEYTSMKKKIFYILLSSVLFIPTGPFRIPIHDHTWAQIGVGMGAGFGWGIFFWLLTRFVLSRFLNEYVMSIKWVNYVLINDYDPKWLYSHWKGKKYEERTKDKKVVPPTPKYKWDRKKILALHLFLAITTFLLGCAGLAIGFVKDYFNPNCDRAAPGILIAMGCYYIVTGILFTLLLFLGEYRFTDKKISPDLITKIVLGCIGTLILTSVFFAIAGIYVSTNDENCNDPNSSVDIAVVYLIIWYSLTGLIGLVWGITYFKWHLRRFYGSRKENPAPKSKDVENQK